MLTVLWRILPLVLVYVWIGVDGLIHGSDFDGMAGVAYAVIAPSIVSAAVVTPAFSRWLKPLVSSAPRVIAPVIIVCLFVIGNRAGEWGWLATIAASLLLGVWFGLDRTLDTSSSASSEYARAARWLGGVLLGALGLIVGGVAELAWRGDDHSVMILVLGTLWHSLAAFLFGFSQQFRRSTADQEQAPELALTGPPPTPTPPPPPPPPALP